jgi:NAD(P)H-nitrite reductase large subunit
MRIVIIGAGPAGVTAVETFRAHDRQAELVILSAEPYPPYSPPAMVEHFLTGSNVHMWREKDWPENQGVEYRNETRVTAIDSEARSISILDGEALAYDKLVIATGSRLYAPLEGGDLPGVYNFKSLSAAEALIQRVKSGAAKTALIVGAGFIGVEIALLLSDLGVKVTQVEMLDQVMPAMLDPETAAFVQQEMIARGVDLQLNTEAEAFIGEDRATGVRLMSGDVLSADAMIAATGVRPNIDFLEGSGIDYDWGISVDEYLRTNVPDVYAAGDVVEVPDRLTGEIYVHAIFPNATAQGNIVGLNLAGLEVRYEGADRMNSLKHLGLPIVAVGLKEGDEVMRTMRNGNLRTLYLRENRLVGFQLVGDVRAAGVLRALILRERDVRPIKDQLLAPTFGQGTVTWEAISATP